jgi:hypothetical protein
MNPGLPSVLYNGMIAPLTNATIRGALWYQGESNVGRHDQYARLFPAMITDWRQRFNNAKMPFYFVEIAPYKYNSQGDAQAAFLREAQRAALKLPATGMVAMGDLGNPADIHPDNKQEVGRRLAAIALKRDYGVADAIESGPVFKAATFAQGGARVELTNTDGLRAAGTGPVTGFIIAGEDQKFFHADARIDGNVVVVSSPKVAAPKAVRYLWNDHQAASVFGGSGLPLGAFRSDDWPAPMKPVADAGATRFLTKEAGFTDIFNGTNLSGWHIVNSDARTWTPAKGDAGEAILKCSGIPTGLLRTAKMYENFVVELEWRQFANGANAGVFIWSDALPARGQPFSRSIEVQVMTGLNGDWFTSDGDIFAIHGATSEYVNSREKNRNRSFPTERRVAPAGEWNHYRIECIDGNISLAVNGKVVTTSKNANPRKGYLVLESEGSETHFRNIKLKELPPSSAGLKPEQVASSDEGFVPLYGGIDFSGWKFTQKHEGHWKANDWTISFDGQGDHLWTEKSYKDFVLVADWRWTGEAKDSDLPVILPDGSTPNGDDGKPKTQRVKEAGDSGIYLRGSDKSQVNIWCWPVGSGEVYGYRTDASQTPEVRAAVTPKVNADAPLGQWNRFVITMKGDRLTVVLNGKTVIEQAQLPGVAAEGPIALQMHGSPIEFANLLIKELPAGGK